MKEAHELFEALRLHLTSNYDFHKYNGKLKTISTPKINLNQILKVADTRSKLIYFFLWNQILYQDQNGHYAGFIGEFLEKNSIQNYKNLIAYLKNLKYHLTSELTSILEMNGNVLDDANHIVNLYYNGKMSFITLLCLYKHTNYKNQWEQSKNPLMQTLLKKLAKTENFFKIDKQKFSDIFSEVLTSSINNSSLCNV